MAGGCRAIASGFRGIRIGHGNRPGTVRRRTSFDRRHRCGVPTGSTRVCGNGRSCPLSNALLRRVALLGALRVVYRCHSLCVGEHEQLVEAVGAPGKLLAANGRMRCASVGTGLRKTVKIESLTPNIIVLFVVLFGFEIRSASATDFCIELTTTEINHRQERRGDANACAGDESTDIKNAARGLARSNANNAIASQCLNDVTLAIGERACARIRLVANTSPNSLWTDFPPAAKPNADNVRYIGPGVGQSAGVNLCTVVRDVRVRTRSVVDGHCSHDIGLLPHRNLAGADRDSHPA
jgi:hypothetical protein